MFENTPLTLRYSAQTADAVDEYPTPACKKCFGYNSKLADCGAPGNVEYPFIGISPRVHGLEVAILVRVL